MELVNLSVFIHIFAPIFLIKDSYDQWGKVGMETNNIFGAEYAKIIRK